jgi:preprotein translocase subunit SecG
MPNHVKWAISLAAGVAIVALGWKVPFVLYAVHVLLCFLLIGVVLMQSGKAADLAGAFGGSGSQTAFGPRGAATILSKITTWCFVMFLLTTVSLTLRQSRIGPTGSSVLERTQQPASAPASGQPAPAQPAPAQQTPAQPTAPPSK